MSRRRRRNSERQPPSKAQLVKALVDKWAFADLIDFHGGSKAFGDCHRELVAWQDSDKREHRRQLILMPRGHLKTTVSTVLDILHSLYVNPNLRIFVGSGNQGLAKAILRECMSNFTDQWLQDNVWNNRPHFSGRMIPILDSYGRIQQYRKRREESLDDGGDIDGEDLDTSDEKKVIWRQDLGIQLVRTDKMKEPSVVIGSVNSPSTGFHYDRLYLDDIINFDNYDKPDKIERLDTWRNDMFNVLDDSFFDEDLKDRLFSCTRSKNYRDIMEGYCHVGGDIFVVGTRYFKHDWYKKLIDQEVEDGDESSFVTYVRNIYKNFSDNSGGYLWHERWSEKIEKQRRMDTSKKNFYAQYLNKIVISEDQTIPWCKMTTLNPAGIERKEGVPRILYKKKDETLDIMPSCVIDPAATYNEASDYTAIVIGGKDKRGNLYILDLWCGKESSVKWVKRAYDMCRKWGIKRIHLETVSFASELKTTFQLLRPTDYPVYVADYKPKSRITKKERIENGLQPLTENGMIFVQPWMSKLGYVTEQFDFFPSESVKDDVPDAFQMLNDCTKTPSQYKGQENLCRMSINKRWGGTY